MDVLRLTLRQLQIFVAVAQAGSTAAGSESVALSQSATSAAVIELERLLSLRMFDRIGKRLLLNDNGRALLPRAQQLLVDALAVERLAHGSDEQLQWLRIGASTTLGNHVMPQLLAAFFGPSAAHAESWHSGVTINNTGDICAMVARSELDIGLIEGPCRESALVATPWLQDDMVLVAAPAPDGNAMRSLAQLSDAVWLLREPGSGTRETTDRAILPFLQNYRRVIELGSSEAIQRAAAAGLGIACLSRWVVQDKLDSGQLVTLQTQLPPITRQCYWVVHRDRPFTPALQRWVDLLQSPVGLGDARQSPP